MEKKTSSKWTKQDKDFLKLIEQYPVLYNGNKRKPESIKAYKAISEEMGKLGK